LLGAVTAASLRAQTDQDFLWTVFVDPRIPGDIEEQLGEILAPLDGRAVTRKGGHNSAVLQAIAREEDCADDSGAILTGRIDDDDAWNVHTVADVRRRVGERSAANCGDGFGLSYENGYVWTMYDMVDVDQLLRRRRPMELGASLRPYAYPFHSMSGFVYSTTGQELTSISAAHSKIPDALRRGGLGVEVIRDTEPMWLYCRHKQTITGIQRAGDSREVRVSLDELAKTFGIDRQQTQEYIEDADRFGYSIVKRNFSERHRLQRKMTELDEVLADPVTTESVGAEIMAKKTELLERLKNLEENVVGDWRDIESESST
jgi:hypothetical protein